jgi:putative hydrolase, CocE/NonD family
MNAGETRAAWAASIGPQLAAIKAAFPSPSHALGERRTEKVAMRDGAALLTDLFLPEGAGPWPTVLIRNPYAGPNAMMMAAAADALNGEGYAVVHQRCRGTSGSEGEWEPFVHERDDGLDCLDWLRVQGWQDGNIGMFGASYLSFAQWFVADRLPPEVKTLYLFGAGTERYRQMYSGGMFRHEIYTCWALGNCGLDPSIDIGPLYQKAIRMRPHVDMDETLVGKRLDWYRDWVGQAGFDNSLWQEGCWPELQSIPSRIAVPICIVAGWFDHHLDGMMRAYANLRPETRAKSRLIVGPWAHDLETHGDLEFPGSQVLGPLGLTGAVEWFDHFLKGRPLRGKAGTARVYVIGDGRWREWPSWPPQTRCATYYLDAGASGTLSETIPEAARALSYDYDPEHPVPTRGGSGLLAWLDPRMGGAAPASLLQPEPGYRPDVLSFVSEPLPESATIVGRTRVRLLVSSSAEDTAFTAKLMELKPDGKAYNIGDGISSLAFRAGIERAAPYEPGTAVSLDLEFWPIAWRVGAASRLRLDVSSSNFPAYHAHPNVAGPWASIASVRVARQTLYAGAPGASFIELPIAAESYRQ